MRWHSPPNREGGQSLVEYAMIVVLVILVVTAVLVLLGPGIGNLYSTVISGVQSQSTPAVTPGITPSPEQNVIVSISATRTGQGHGNSVLVTIVVSVNTLVTVTDSQRAAPVTNVPCNGSCVVPLGGVGPNAGIVTVTASQGGTATAAYPARQ